MPAPSQSLPHDFIHPGQVGPGGQLRHDASIKGVHVLGVDYVPEQTFVSGK
jgi:hypothetical protein